jgi:magnesium transporter
MLDVQEQETTEDIQKLGGSEALQEPYIDTPLWRLVRKRVVWLVILFLGGMLTATVIGAFQKSLERAVVLSIFMPLIISAGGNAGSQASTLIIRAMSLGEVHLSDWWRVMKKEILSGLLLGGILAVLGFLRVVGWQNLESAFGGNPYGQHYVWIGLTFAIAVLGVVMWGTIAGSMLPLVLRRLGFDPATSSAPFVATLVDVTGLIIYFFAATLILTGTVL